MIILLSPAKSLNFSESSYQRKSGYTALPIFIKDANYIANQLKQLSLKQLQSSLGISEKISLLNFSRFQSWKSENIDKSILRYAVFAFNGDVYKKLDVYSLQPCALDFLQKHVRILSGLYGILKPYDLIRPYRLDMRANFSVNNLSLYEYWRVKVTEALNRECIKLSSSLKQTNAKIINLASTEYSNILNLKKCDAKIITPVFQEYKNGSYKVIGISSKRARGLMVRFICSMQCINSDEIKRFNLDGYKFEPLVSNDTDWIFRKKT